MRVNRELLAELKARYGDGKKAADAMGVDYRLYMYWWHREYAIPARVTMIERAIREFLNSTPTPPPPASAVSTGQ